MCRCYVLPEHHKIISMQQRHLDVRVVTTQSQDLKHTKDHHLEPYTFTHEVGVDVFEIVDSVAIRFSILNAVCMGTTYDQAWIVRVPETRWFSIISCMSASLRAWLDTLGRLA